MGDSTPVTAKKGLSRVTGAAGLIMFATLLSRVTGFLRTTLIYNLMDGPGYSDEFILAFSLPDIAFNLLAGGAIAAALIPVMSSLLSKDREKEAWKALSTFLNLTVILLVVLEIVCFIWTDGLLSIVAAGYTTGRGNRDMTLKLTRILLLSVPFMMLAGQCNGILNSYRKFAAAAFGPVVYNVCTILGIGLFGKVDVYLTAWTIVGSAFVFFVLQMAATWKQFRRYRPVLDWHAPAFRRMFRQAIPSLASSTIAEVNNVMARGFATFLDKGMLTLLNNANRTWQLPLGIFAQSVGIAMLPTLSAHHAAKEYDAFRTLFNRGVRAVFLISLPFSGILIVEGEQIMRLLFKWGDRPESHVFFSGIALMGYAAALLFASILGLTTRAFYAMHDSLTPLVTGVLGIFANYGFNWLFQRFTEVGIAGTAMAYTFTSFLSMMILLLLFSQKTGIRFFVDNGRFFARALVAVLPGCVVMWGMTLLLRPNVDSKLSQLVCATLPALFCMVTFYFAAIAMRIREMGMLKEMLATRLARFHRGAGTPS